MDFTDRVSKSMASRSAQSTSHAFSTECSMDNHFLDCIEVFIYAFKLRLAQEGKIKPKTLFCLLIFFTINFGERMGEKREREKHWLVVPFIDAFIGCFLYVPRRGIEPPTLGYR